MKVPYKHFQRYIDSDPSIDELSEKLFQLGHEHEINEEILKVDLINKGLMRAETWEQIERVILKLQDATSLQN